MRTKPATRPVRITGWTKPSTIARVLGVPAAEQRAIHAAVEAFIREYGLKRMYGVKTSSAKARRGRATARKSKAPAKRRTRKS